jgi:transposase InsO family protein
MEELLNRRHTEHLKCPACMIGKATLEDYPSKKASASKPLRLIDIDSFSSSVVSIEGFVHAVVIVDSCTGYRWLYGMKTKDGMLEVIKKWYADIADLRQTYQVVCVMRDNAGENRSNDVFEFLNSHGIRSHFSEAYEQWQNGSAESSIDFQVIMLLARTVMAES